MQHEHIIVSRLTSIASADRPDRGRTEGMKLAIPVTARDHAQGPATAPVTLVMYGDYECSYCGRAYPIVKAVQKAMGDKLRFVFRNYPLTQSHPHALHAAEVAEAVALHGDFWAIHDALYEHQSALDDQHLLGYAKHLGLDHEKVAKDASSDTVIAQLRADIEGGDKSGVNGTPAFYINGTQHEGSWDYEPLLHAIQSVAKG
jgi:protein-disulfide isomerase